MAAKHLVFASILIAAVIYTQAAPGAALGCSKTEETCLFNKCLLVKFGVPHLRMMKEEKKRLRQQPGTEPYYCNTTLLQCNAVRDTVNCVNTLMADENALSHNCRVNLSASLTSLLLKYKFGCTYQEIDAHCRNNFFPQFTIPDRPPFYNGPFTCGQPRPASQPRYSTNRG